MSPAQNNFYWRLWAAVRRADPKQDRKDLHAKAGLPDSHTAFSNEHFDAFKAACLAITQPVNYRAQAKQEAMPATRHRHAVEQLAAALAVGEEYLDAIVARMHRKGNGLVTYAEAPAGDVWKLFIALKLECRRRWTDKPALISAMRTFAAESEIQDQDARQAAAEALGVPFCPPLEKIPYDRLLIAFAAVRKLCKVEEPF